MMISRSIAEVLEISRILRTVAGYTTVVPHLYVHACSSHEVVSSSRALGTYTVICN